MPSGILPAQQTDIPPHRLTFLLIFVRAGQDISLYLGKKSCVRFVCNMCRLDPLPWVYSTSRIYTHTCVQKKNESTLVWGGFGWVGEYRPPLMAARIRKKEESSAPAPIMVLSRAHRVPVSSSIWSNIDVVSFHPFLFLIWKKLLLLLLLWALFPGLLLPDNTSSSCISACVQSVRPPTLSLWTPPPLFLVCASDVIAGIDMGGGGVSRPNRTHFSLAWFF